MGLRGIFYKLVGSFIKNFNRILKPTTLGARIIVVKNNRILLLKHTNGSSWYLPGGGIKRGELPIDNVIRELREESGLDIEGYSINVKPLGVYNNLYEGKNDYIFIFSLDLSDIEEKIILNIDNLEIVEAEFFDMQDLPDGISPGTQRRILELRENSGGFLFKKW